MEAVILCGIQASGKSTFCRERFTETHIRLNLDMLRTRHRESVLLAACLEAKQSFVIDNTNPTRDERARYIEAARAAGFRVVGYYFSARLAEAALAATANTALAQRSIDWSTTDGGVEGDDVILFFESWDSGEVGLPGC